VLLYPRGRMAHDGDHTPTPEPGSWSAILLQEAGHLLDAVGSWRRGVAARRADRLLARYRYLQREAAPPAVPPATVAPTLPVAPAPEPERVAAWTPAPAPGPEPVTGWVPASAPARELEAAAVEPEPEPEAAAPEPEAVEPEPEAVEPVEPEPEPGPPSAWLVRDPEAEPEPEPSAEQDAAPGQPSWLPPGQG
jgi:hypothetical protein